MRGKVHINRFCIIRNRKVMLSHEVLLAEKGIPVQDFLKKAYRHFRMEYPKFHKMDNLSKLGILAAELIMRDNDPEGRYSGDKTGIILANAAASLDTDRNHQRSIDDRNNYFPSPSVFVYTLPNIVMGEICIRHQLFGENTFFIQEKFDTGFIHQYVNLLFESDIIDRCLTGWLEVDGDNYEAVLYLAEKTDRDNGGIAIFDEENMKKIYALKC